MKLKFRPPQPKVTRRHQIFAQGGVVAERVVPVGSMADPSDLESENKGLQGESKGLGRFGEKAAAQIFSGRAGSIDTTPATQQVEDKTRGLPDP
ncbi:hypothetical protein AYI69_g7041 [Smittium culicis]|uniref:Uncharacterized protein n=1 Tax=Smittium culicis TaxID=133412 RepID=A0A1R1XUV1_9FUNG|nr:hypothetical protein AYI69_g7041 [Smittium culicis]